MHTEDYLDNFINGKISEQEQRRTGFPWSEGIVRRCRYETGERNSWRTRDPERLHYVCC